MVLYIVGLGLGDEKDITIRGLECVKRCKKLYLEYYTSILGIDHVKLEKFYGVPIILADRTMVIPQFQLATASFGSFLVNVYLMQASICSFWNRSSRTVNRYT
jgi:diphthamide biosynthesis methyltransferase